MAHIVYKHTAPNGKCYIGITKQTLERRCRNGRGYAGNHAFYHAIQKYGWDNFSHEILESNLTPQEASEMERYYIKLYHSLSTDNGYNIECGGLTSFHVSEDSRRKIALSRIGKKMPPRGEEHRKKLSESLRGRTFSDEHCRHISKSKKGKKMGKDNPRARKVMCIETGIVYETIKAAGASSGCDAKNITSCCAGRLNSAGGYHWRYVEDTEVRV